MAYNMKDVFYLDTSMVTGTSSGQGITTLDLSSYVDPIARNRSKGTGLAIYKVHFNISDSDGNSPYSRSATGNMRAALASISATADAAVGSGSIVTNTLNASNDLMIAGVDFAAGGTAAGDPDPIVFLEPSADVPYVVVRDAIALLLDIPTAMSVSAQVSVRLECAQVTLDQATLNQLLRTQTV
tara:strand:- start:686 stop:1237 length:552 start_codon:yes stop_codon:yes gene_type:complete